VRHNLQGHAGLSIGNSVRSFTSTTKFTHVARAKHSWASGTACSTQRNVFHQDQTRYKVCGKMQSTKYLGGFSFSTTS
jgi:hypothetical protein